MHLPLTDHIGCPVQLCRTHAGLQCSSDTIKSLLYNTLPSGYSGKGLRSGWEFLVIFWVGVFYLGFLPYDLSPDLHRLPDTISKSFH